MPLFDTIDISNLSDKERINFEWINRLFERVDHELTTIRYGVRVKLRSIQQLTEDIVEIKEYHGHDMHTTAVLNHMREDLCEILPRIQLVPDPELKEQLHFGLLARLGLLALFEHQMKVKKDSAFIYDDVYKTDTPLLDAARTREKWRLKTEKTEKGGEER